jgi:hypothetical protein
MVDITITLGSDDQGPLYEVRGLTMRPGESITLPAGQVLTVNSVTVNGATIITPTFAMRSDGPDPDGVLARVR